MKKWIELLAENTPGVGMVFLLLKGYKLFRGPFGLEMIGSIAGLLLISLVLYVIFVAVPQLMAEENKMKPQDVLIGYLLFIAGIIYWFAKNANI